MDVRARCLRDGIPLGFAARVLEAGEGGGKNVGGIGEMTALPPGWTSDRLKDVAAINAASLPADTNPDYEFDYLEIS